MIRLGDVVVTAGVAETIKTDPGFLVFCSASLTRHENGDWGDVSDEDKKQNDYAAKHDERVLSSFTNKNGKRIWIITEWDRSTTAILFPSEY